jgi:hypothetical protein
MKCGSVSPLWEDREWRFIVKPRGSLSVRDQRLSDDAGIAAGEQIEESRIRTQIAGVEGGHCYTFGREARPEFICVRGRGSPGLPYRQSSRVIDQKAEIDARNTGPSGAPVAASALQFIGDGAPHCAALRSKA